MRVFSSVPKVIQQLLLPRLLVTCFCPCIFPSITSFRRQFLRKMWPIQLALRFPLILKLDGDECLKSQSLSPRRKSPDAHYIGSWAGILEKKFFFSPAGIRTQDLPARSQVTYTPWIVHVNKTVSCISITVYKYTLLGRCFSFRENYCVSTCICILHYLSCFPLSVSYWNLLRWFVSENRS
jgi:hypothetical protein